MKFVDINLIKHMLDLHADNYKMLKKKEIKEDLINCKDIP